MLASLVMGALVSVFFLGGWHGPLLPPVVWLLIKIIVVALIMIWMRGTLPRLRYDQLMALGWKVLIPAALIARLVRRVPVVVDVHEDVPAAIGQRDWIPGPLRRPLAWVAALLPWAWLAGWWMMRRQAPRWSPIGVGLGLGWLGQRIQRMRDEIKATTELGNKVTGRRV